MDTSEEDNLRQPAPNTAETLGANVPAYSLGEGAVAAEPETIRMQLHFLRRLDETQEALKRYIGAYFGSQERFGPCVEFIGWLSAGRKTDPKELQEDFDYWLKIEQTLDKLAPLGDLIETFGLAEVDDDDFLNWRNTFDEHLEASMGDVRSMQRLGQSGDVIAVVSELQTRANDMRDLIVKFSKKCRTAAERMADEIKDRLHEIVQEMEIERRVYERTQGQQPRVFPKMPL